MASRDRFDLENSLRIAYSKAEARFNTENKEINVFLTCTHRDNAEQNGLYAQGRTVKGSIVTNAKGGQSPHNYKPAFAFDIAFIGLSKKLVWDKKYFKRFAEIMKEEMPDIDCGIDWVKLPDAPHFQIKNWKKLIK